ncbi:TPA: hypothetical protein ACHJAW_001521 [Klebsiella pneumoniae]|uniref:hypothetical protein n=1 Tax=Klebsiella pneumoniae complex TaxID=3390273 RepID=UPI0003BF3726|nr:MULTISPECIES: hypothetical protein [Klebsiella]ELA1606593.1 hypothetical protein [Klebsiella pneumoniae]ESN44913.1 hypothetical protein L366_00994 [Klebsiella variicola]RNT56960.1 hypothetical protein B9051_018855 [Klebsiella pneumoniae]SLR17640.1 Uncharacterised protein [Klebsiella pneumoniae]HBQ7906280.1 hypothetical protein [Klebsiella pneumoniae]
MTITLQAVNELIASLESAGELSIREQKYLKLAKAFKQLAAENAALKSYIRDECYVTPPNSGPMAEADLPAEEFMPETPATDRIVAEAEARGVEKFAAKLRIPGDDQFFDALAKGVALAADDFAKQLREWEDK